MATLEEQLESALEGTQSAMSASDIGEIISGTATSIQPGTITPITSQQSNQLSWKNVFDKISEGIELQPGEGLPEVPKNIPASTFYRTATQAGALPAGGSQFSTQPLAPETPAMETGVTETAATEPETTVTSDAQKVARQLEESYEPHDSGTDVDFYHDPFAQHMEQTRIEQTLALGRDPNAIGIDRVKNDMALLGSAVGKRAGDPKTLLGLALPMELSIPLTILQGVFSEGHGQIGRSGIVADDYWNPGGAGLGPATPTQVYGFASIPGNFFSIAVDSQGREVNTREGGAIFGIGNTEKGQRAYDARQMGIDVKDRTYEDYANKAKRDYEERLAAGRITEGYNEFTTVEEQAQLAADSAKQNMQESLVSPGLEEGGYSETAASGDPSGDKIICTMMNRMYGLGNYRAKQWLLYSNRYLTPEHQLGYHKLYYKLVSMMPSNKLIAKVLSHIANKRTDDIVAEMKGMKRSWLGRIYRATLIDTPSYVVGLMIKRNWLKPADISILN